MTNPSAMMKSVMSHPPVSWLLTAWVSVPMLVAFAAIPVRLYVVIVVGIGR